MATEVEQRLGQDLGKANISYADAIGIIMSNGEEWGNQMDLIRAGKFQEAMTSIETSISEIEEYLADSPGAKDILSFTLARAYENKGWCIVMQAGSKNPPNNAMARQGIQWVDKAFATANYPPEYGKQAREMRTHAVNSISQKEREASTGNSSNTTPRRTSATPRIQSFTEVSAICPKCGQRSTLKWREEKCASGVGVCTYDMNKFESGGGLFCTKCSRGFHADTRDKGEGVLRCKARITASGPSGYMSVDCNKPIPATPSCIKPIIREQKKGGCYIASATLKCGGDDSQLFTLRKWRNEVMRATKLGRNLEILYDKTGPVVANRVADNTVLAKTFLYPFVKPSIWLTERRIHYPQWTWFFNLLIYGIFLTGLMYGLVIYGFVSAKNSVSA